VRCEAKWYVDIGDKRRPGVGKPCRTTATFEVEGKKLCYVHASVVLMKRATLDQVLRGERGKNPYDYRGRRP
jgi:hypothetical protein